MAEDSLDRGICLQDSTKPLEEFLRGCLLVKELAVGTTQLADAKKQTSEQWFPIALLDNDPSFSYTDIARAREQLTAFTYRWSRWVRGNDVWLRLRCTCKEPLDLTFAIAFHCKQHWDLLRWVIERDGFLRVSVIPSRYGALFTPSEHELGVQLVLPIPIVKESLQPLLIMVALHQRQIDTSFPLSGAEAIITAFEANRCLSLSRDIIPLCQSIISLPVDGVERMEIEDVTGKKSLVLEGISPSFKIALSEACTASGATVHWIENEPYLVHPNWGQTG